MTAGAPATAAAPEPGEGEDVLDHPQRRPLTIRGIAEAFVIVVIVLLGLGASLLLNIDGPRGVSGSSSELVVGSAAFMVPDSWRAMPAGGQQRLEGAVGGSAKEVVGLCPPVRRVGVPFPCAASTGFLWAGVIQPRGTLPARATATALERQLARTRRGFDGAGMQQVLTRDNTTAYIMDYSFRVDDRFVEYRGVAAVLDVRGGAVVVLAEGPDPALRAVRVQVRRMVTTARQA